MLSSITSRQLSEWMAYYGIEPFGPNIDDLRDARRNMYFVQANSGKDANVRLEEFMLSDLNRKPQEMTPEQVKAIMMGFC